MAALAVSDLVFGDILSENNLKPWWEKYRGYCFAGNAFSAVSLVYLTIVNGISLSCLPLGQNLTDGTNFHETQAAAVNIYCGNFHPWYVTYVGAFEFGMALLILIVSSLWLNHPGVINVVRNFVEAEKITSTFELNLKDLTDAISRTTFGKNATDLPTDRDRQLREAVIIIWNGGSVDVRKLYKYRNGILLGILIAALVLSLVWTSILWMTSNKFLCDVLDDDLQKNYPGVDAYVCFLSHTSLKLGAFTLSCFLSQLGQALFVCVSLQQLRIAEKKSLFFSREGNIADKNASFLGLFWKSASPSRSGRFHNFSINVFSWEVRNAMKSSIERGIIDGDMNFVNMYYRNNESRDVVDAVVAQIQKQGSDYRKSEENLFEMLKQISFKSDELQSIVKTAAKKKRWRLLMKALEMYFLGIGRRIRYDLEWLKKMDVNLDELQSLPDLTSSEQGAGSILFYALKGLLLPTRLFTNTHDRRVKYVHFQGKSQTLYNYLQYDDDDDDFPSDDAAPSRSQEEIGRLGAKLKQAGASPSVEYVQCLTNDIYRYKFTHWDKNANDLATHSNDNRLWTVLVTLLNAYIVTEEDRPKVAKLTDCDVTHFESLDEIFPIALKTQPLGFDGGYFVSTAARHILACCSREERNSCLKQIHDPQNKLSETDKTYLLYDENDMKAWDNDSDNGHDHTAVMDPTTESANVVKPSELAAEVHASNDQGIDHDQSSNTSVKKRMSTGSHAGENKVEEQTQEDADGAQDDTLTEIDETIPKKTLVGPCGGGHVLAALRRSVAEDNDRRDHTVTDPTTKSENVGKPSELTAKAHTLSDQGRDHGEVSTNGSENCLSTGSHAEQKGENVEEQTQEDADGVPDETDPKIPLLLPKKTGL